MNRVLLREAGIDDAEMLTNLLRAAFEEYRGVLEPPSGAHSETEESVRKHLESGKAVIATVDDVNAGCVFYEPAGESIYMHRLGVLPAFRGSGVGRALVASVEARAKEGGYKGVRLGTRLVLTKNRAFYERLGYQLVGYGEKLWQGEPFYVVYEKRFQLPDTGLRDEAES
jgi:GNAT superfamily N-acetyltransferase